MLTFNETYSSEKESNVLLISSYWIIDEHGTKNIVPAYGVWNLGYNLVQSRKNASVTVLDPNLFESIGQVEQYLLSRKFQLVWVSIIPANLENDLVILDLVRRIQGWAKLIVGGVESYTLEPYILQIKWLVDYLVVWDWIPAISRILDWNIDETESKNRVIYSQESASNKAYIPNELIPVGKPDDVHTKAYPKTNNGITTNNKCHLDCFWCVSPKHGAVFSSIPSLISAIRELHVEGMPFTFHDNDIAYDPVFLKQLCDGLSSEWLDMPKHAKSTLITMTSELLTDMKKANFVRIAYGVESFDDRVRKWLWKKFHDKTVDSILVATLDAGITPEINLILFTPFEDIASLKQTVRKSAIFVSKWAIPFVNNNLYAVLWAKKHWEQRWLVVNKKVIEIKSIQNGGSSIEIPSHYKVTDPVMQKLVAEFESLYTFELAEMWQPSQLQKSLLKLEVCAKLLGLSDQENLFRSIRMEERSTNYVNI